jgi:hypothetical protein
VIDLLAICSGEKDESVNYSSCESFLEKTLHILNQVNINGKFYIDPEAINYRNYENEYLKS